MSPQAQLVMILWLPIVLFFFVRFPPRTAIIVSFIGGLLFLPQKAGFKLPLIPDYQGALATCYAILLGIFLFDFGRLRAFKPAWVDLPMLLWCICPAFSSLLNGLGAYDAVNETLGRSAAWGLPYFIGRLYLGNLAGLKELAINIVKGGLLYVPLCLYEIRMSPQLHNTIYGYYAHGSGVSQAIRQGGWRPMVFMEHGLVVALWMMTVTLIAIWLWKAEQPKTIWEIPLHYAVIAFIATFVLLKSSGALLFLMFGMTVLFVAKWGRTNLPLLFLILGICFYLYLAVSGSFDGDRIVSLASQLFSPERAQSLQFRFDNEELLRAKAMERMVFGWGGWGRSRVLEENWEGDMVDISVTDSLWIIAFGVNGLVGLVSLTASMLVPVICFGWFGYPVKTWFNPKVAPAAALGVALVLYMVNCLINGHFLPIYPMISGGLSGLALSKKDKSVASGSRASHRNRTLKTKRSLARLREF
ncbi:MAG: O-antigen ligase domain-containing protein [Hydrococcus sp. C42_A2020_068]|uniref:hypothetical protein n=1 Tax=Pleurocapsa sp. PCC 7327 TaxID=118163 RepID=UPI00029FA28F|nr:hypothetical protein [Pleurocapsa sp. PCC 7327]AFY77846.1 hypothetical protein Ple7327_2560 [Pleurocapsa sp. PCC 7327]MBF2019558.1 O-antigen ligase domain-containing protein [Hydrococcus sp. C42_A2020_068]